jgi:adenosylhomocysteine nucleosidase
MSASERPAVVVTAIREELDALLLRLGTFSSQRIGGRKVFRSAVCSPPLLLVSTGDGPGNAERAAREMCELFGPTALLGLGVAGALTPALQPLELVASARLQNGARTTPPADPLLLSLATSNGARAGTLVTVSAPVVSVAAKESIASGLSADEPAAVDMESAAWARGAAQTGTPFVIVRAIADGAKEELPDYLADCLGPDGGIRRTAVVRQALTHPASVPVLLHMKRRVAACGQRLAEFLTDFFVC